MESDASSLLPHNRIVQDFVVPIAGINLFADAPRVSSLPGPMMALYMCDAFPAKAMSHYCGLEALLKYNTADRCGASIFASVKGGNDLIIKSLLQRLQQRAGVSMRQSRAPAKIRFAEGDPDSGAAGSSARAVLVDGERFDAVAIACQPVDALALLPEGLEPHTSICRCFYRVHAHSVVHTCAAVFEGVPDGHTLAYDTDNGHHYLHIDAAMYNLEGLPPRAVYITVYYDKAPCPGSITAADILSQSTATLSCPHPKDKLKLYNLLMRLRTEHSNIFLCNAAYMGYMWHEDACAMAMAVSHAFD